MRVKALQAGGEAFLSKPFDKSELIAQIKAMLQLSEARQLQNREKTDLDALIYERTKALHQSELNYRMLFDNATVAIVIEQDGLIKLCNNKVHEYLGYAMSELVGQPYIDFIYPDDRQLIVEKHRQRIQANSILSKYAFRLLTKQGGYIWAETEAIVSDWEGKPAILGFLTDITKQVNAYLKLLQSEERYRNIFNNSSIGIYQTTPEGTYRTVNMAFAQIYGYSSPEEMIASVKNIGDELYADPSDRIRLLSMLNVSNAEVKNFETLAKKRDGGMVWVSINARMVMDADSGTRYFEGTCSDITEIKVAQIALDQHNRLMKSLTDAAQDAILMMDHHGLISYWNPAAERIFGFSEQETLGQNLHMLIAPIQYHPAHLEAFGKFLLTGSGDAIGKTVELEAIRKDGETISVELSLSAVLVNRNWHATGIIRDITQRKRAELELKQAKDKAEESDKLKTAFLNNISHEIRTPFNGILGFISMVLDEDKQEFVDIIHLSAERLMTTINNIVEMSRLQSGHLELKLTEFRLTSVFDSVLCNYKAEATKRGLSLSIVNQLDEYQDMVKADRDVLYYVLSHLINNAIKFTKEGAIVIEAQPTPEGVRVAVKDSGIGIPFARQKDIFKKFTQADFSSTRQFEGSGLGLSIAAEYVTKLQSEIKLISEEGKGAEFYFVLPTVHLQNHYLAEAPVQNTGVFSANSIPVPTILFAEDDDVSHEFVYKVLSKAGYAIFAAHNGAQAVELFKDNPQINLVIMDLRMPELDGFEATKAIRLLDGHVPIVVLTAYTLSDERRQAFDAGCNECLKKPISKEQILEMVQKYL
jgi:PAS domain S-box-containing protein